jgi:hypothetical protein
MVIRQGRAGGVVTARMKRCRIPDLSGMTVGTWTVLYETTEEDNPYCMCRCIRCGVKKMILAIKIRKGYALRCPECRIRREMFAEVQKQF